MMLHHYENKHLHFLHLILSICCSCSCSCSCYYQHQYQYRYQFNITPIHIMAIYHLSTCTHTAGQRTRKTKTSKNITTSSHRRRSIRRPNRRRISTTQRPYPPPRNRRQRRSRQRYRGTTTLPRQRRPRSRHYSLHQLPRWICIRRTCHLRHHEIHPLRRTNGMFRNGGQYGSILTRGGNSRKAKVLAQCEDYDPSTVGRGAGSSGRY